MKTKKYFKEIFAKDDRQDFVIDAIRAFSVLFIIAFHVVVGITQIYNHDKTKQFILEMPAWLQPIWHGEKGVDAFFLLSGLLVGIPFFKNINNYNLKEILIFFSKKFFRIYPLFLFALVLYTIGQWSYFGKYFFSNLFFLNNLIAGERTIIPVGWFLTVEVQYFILIPILFLILKYFQNRGFALLSLFLFSIVCCGAILINNQELYLRPITDLFLSKDRSQFSNLMGRLFYESGLTRFGPFVLGIELAYLKSFYSVKINQLLTKKYISNAIFIIMLVLIFTPTMIPIYNPNSWFYNPFSKIQNFWMLALSRQIFSVGIMLLILGCWYPTGIFKTINKILLCQPWRVISKLSFPIYLFHFPFIGVAAIIVFGTTNVKEIEFISFYQGAAVFFVATLLTVLFSIPLHIYIEKRWINKFKDSKTKV